MQYQTLVEEVRDLAGLPDSESAVQAAAATVGALGHVLADDKRRRVQEVLPGKLRASMAADAADAPAGGRQEDQTGFIAEVAGRCHCTTAQARLRAQATLSVLAHHEPEVFASLEPPDWFEQLSAIPLPGGGLTSVRGGTPPLTDDEVQRALADLPGWTGDTTRLTRAVALQAENVEGVLPVVEAVLRDGHGGHVERTDEGLSVVLRTRSVDAVTSYDIETAQRVEDALIRIGAAIARPKASGGTPQGTWSRQPVVLFGGTGLQGWRMCGAGGFDLVGSAIQSRGGLGMLWYAEREFTDFTLTLDWRVAHASDTGGVFVRFPDPGDDPWVALTEGYEVQLRDQGEGAQGTGAICGLAAPYVDPPLKQPGEWNHLEVRVHGQSYRVGVNGREVTSFRGERGASGYIGIQNHDNESRVQYRDIWVFEDDT